MIYLGTFEEVGYADVIRTGKSSEEVEKIIRKSAKKLGAKVKITHVRKHPKGGVVLDTRTGRCYLEEQAC